VRVGPEMFFSRCISSGFHLLVILVYSLLLTEVFAEGLVDLEIISVHSSWCSLGGCRQRPADSVIVSVQSGGVNVLSQQSAGKLGEMSRNQTFPVEMRTGLFLLRSER
jgi:hypothetical protein